MMIEISRRKVLSTIAAGSTGPQLSLSSGGTVSREQTGDQDWPQADHDPANSGFATGSVIKPNEMQKQWVTKLNTEISHPVIVNGVCYLGTKTGVTAIDADSGQKIWERTFNKEFSQIAFRDGRLYAANSFGEIYALDPKLGNLKWKRRISELKKGTEFLVNTGTTIYTSNYNGEIYALNAAEEGKTIWTKSLGDKLFGMAMSDEELILSNPPGTVVAVDPQSGQELWRHSFSQGGPAIPSVGNGIVFVGRDNSILVALDTKTGEPKWKKKLGSNGFFSNPSISEGTAYVGDLNGFLWAFDVQSGEQKWRSEVGGSIFGSPAITSGYVVVTSADRYIYIFDKRSGDKVRKIGKVWMGVGPAPAVAGNQIVISSSNKDGGVYAFKAPEAGKTTSRETEESKSRKTQTTTSTKGSVPSVGILGSIGAVIGWLSLRYLKKK